METQHRAWLGCTTVRRPNTQPGCRRSARVERAVSPIALLAAATRGPHPATDNTDIGRAAAQIARISLENQSTALAINKNVVHKFVKVASGHENAPLAEWFSTIEGASLLS